MFENEAWVPNVPPAAHTFEIALPALAVGRVGEHEVEFLARKAVLGESGAEPKVLRIGTLALDKQVRLGYGVGLRVDLLAEEMDADVLTVLFR